jgi:hypothetical protein
VRHSSAALAGEGLAADAQAARRNAPIWIDRAALAPNDSPFLDFGFFVEGNRVGETGDARAPAAHILE